MVLLDDGTNLGAESLREVIPTLHVEVFRVEPGSLAAALPPLADYLSGYDYLSFLLPGDAYEPTRVSICLGGMLREREGRFPMMVVTAIRPTDSRGQDLPLTDPRTEHLERLWAPGYSGAEIAEWLGMGYFAGPISNIFVRREYLSSLPLPENNQHLAQLLVLSAAMQGLIGVEYEPLLRHYPPLVSRPFSLNAASENLQLQLDLLYALRERLAFSPETRRHFAAYHRAAWNSLSGLREDLFQQLVLQLASGTERDTAQAALGAILRTREANNTPAHWPALFDGKDRFDVAGYADALRRTRERLDDALKENSRLKQIADTAQGSGWVRFGAWLGERSARRMMELEEAENEAPVVKNEIEEKKD